MLFLVYSACGTGKRLTWSTKKFGPLAGIKTKSNKNRGVFGALPPHLFMLLLFVFYTRPLGGQTETPSSSASLEYQTSRFIISLAVTSITFKVARRQPNPGPMDVNCELIVQNAARPNTLDRMLFQQYFIIQRCAALR